MDALGIEYCVGDAMAYQPDCSPAAGAVRAVMLRGHWSKPVCGTRGVGATLRRFGGAARGSPA